jgi:hypothetical protein
MKLRVFSDPLPAPGGACGVEHCDDRAGECDETGPHFDSSFLVLNLVRATCRLDEAVNQDLPAPGGACGVEHCDDRAGECDETGLHVGDSFSVAQVIARTCRWTKR